MGLTTVRGLPRYSSSLNVSSQALFVVTVSDKGVSNMTYPRELSIANAFTRPPKSASWAPLNKLPISSMEKHSSVIVSDNTKIKIRDIEGNRPILIVDGEVRIPLKTKEMVIEKSPYSANFVIFSKKH